MSAIVWDDSALKKEVRDKSEKKLIQAAETVASICKRSMGSGKEGYRAYSKTQKKIDHYSSEPGQPPHVDTGRLRSSITWAISEGAQQGNAVKSPAKEGDQVSEPDKRMGEIIAVVGTNVDYAKALEFGFAPRNLAARPYLRPALEKTVAKIRWLFDHE
jgi:phage gpG-like protein